MFTAMFAVSQPSEINPVGFLIDRDVSEFFRTTLRRFRFSPAAGVRLQGHTPRN